MAVDTSANATAEPAMTATNAATTKTIVILSRLVVFGRIAHLPLESFTRHPVN